MSDCNINQRLARIYLVSDILYNSTAVPKASRFRALFDSHLNPIFEKLHKVHGFENSLFSILQFLLKKNLGKIQNFGQKSRFFFQIPPKVYSDIESRFVAEQFRTRISTVLRAWAAWSLYTTDTLVKLNNIFVGIQKEDSESENETDSDVDGIDIERHSLKI